MKTIAETNQEVNDTLGGAVFTHDNTPCVEEYPGASRKPAL